MEGERCRELGNSWGVPFGMFFGMSHIPAAPQPREHWIFAPCMDPTAPTLIFQLLPAHPALPAAKAPRDMQTGQSRVLTGHLSAEIP